MGKKMMLLCAILGFGLVACGPEMVETGSVGMKLASVEGGEYCTTLVAGQSIDAGTVCAKVADDNLLLTFSTANSWELTEAHAWIGTSLADMPQTSKGAPKIGNFPYNSGDISGATSYTFTVPLSSLGGEPAVCGQNFYVAAHAALRKPDSTGGYQTETGWGAGSSMPKSWAMYFMITLRCDDDLPPQKECETAFAFGGDLAVPFTGLMDTPRWGWSNGPLGPGSYTFDLYAGAGQNDLSKGTLVGKVAVTYDGSVATVVYTVSSGYTMDETHLYAGSASLPQNSDVELTVAPGQYGNNHDLTDASNDTFTVTGLSGDVFVIAHAVVCTTE